MRRSGHRDGGRRLAGGDRGGRPGCDVIAVTKSVIGKSGATLTADADIDVDSKACIDVFGLPGDPHDSEQAFFEDMIVEGDYTNDQTLVEIHVSEAAKRTKELIDWERASIVLPTRPVIGIHAAFGFPARSFAGYSPAR